MSYYHLNFSSRTKTLGNDSRCLVFFLPKVTRAWSNGPVKETYLIIIEDKTIEHEVIVMDRKGNMYIYIRLEGNVQINHIRVTM